MIHLSIYDARSLYRSLHPVVVKECGNQGCGGCEVYAICDALFDASCGKHSRTLENALHNACARYREYTDAICDTYTCPNCQNYSWCTTLRGIGIEGVKLYE